MNQYLHKCISPDMSVSTMGISSAPTPTIVTTEESSSTEEASDVMIQREEDVQLCNMNVTIPKKKKKYSTSRTRYGDTKKRKQSTEEGTSRASSPTVKDIYKNIVCMGYFSKALSSSQKMHSCKEVQTQDQTNAQHQSHKNIAKSTEIAKRLVVSQHQSVQSQDNKSSNQHDALSSLHKAYLQALNQTNQQ